MPIVTYTHSGNYWGLGLTLSLAAACNLGAYAVMKGRQKKPMLERKEFAIAWSQYEQNIAKVETYVKENNIFLEASLAQEAHGRGLEIVEAYYGLDEHIL